MRRSKLKTCPVCGKQVRARGYHNHITFAHGVSPDSGGLIPRPECSRCFIEAALIFWVERTRRFVFRCPRCYRYLGPATGEQVMNLPLIPDDYDELEELRRRWRTEDLAEKPVIEETPRRPKIAVKRQARRSGGPRTERRTLILE